MKRVMILAVLVLGGCTYTPMTPEQQHAFKIEGHCRDVKQLVQRREMGRLELEHKAKGEYGSFVGGMITQHQAMWAGIVAERECMVSQARAHPPERL